MERDGSTLPRFVIRSLAASSVFAFLALSVGVGYGDTYDIPDGDVAALVAAVGAVQDGDVITLASNGVYVLTEVDNERSGPNGLPVITNEITFQGNGATIRRAGGAPDFRIFFLEGVGSGATFSNLKIVGGRAGFDFSGGGMFLDMSSPEIVDLVFRDNTAGVRGGGMYIRNGSTPTITQCLFDRNVAEIGGGGMSNRDSNPVILRCVFRDNLTWDGDGGGMSNWNSHPTVVDTRFEGNWADFDGGGMFNLDSDPALDDCVFENNFAWAGGGMANVGSHPSVARTLFQNNNASESGGGMANIGFSDPVITDTVFAGNSAWSGGGMENSNSSPIITTSVFRNNKADIGGGVAIIFSSDPAIGSTSFCGNEPDHIDGPWSDLGSNRFTDECGYEEWVRAHFAEPEWEDETKRGLQESPAGDRIPNLMKYALGLDPEKAYGSALPAPEVRTIPGEGTFLTLSFTHPSELTDVSYRVRLSSDLEDWSELAVLVSAEDDGTTTTRTYRDTHPIGNFPQRFLRLEVNPL